MYKCDSADNKNTVYVIKSNTTYTDI